MANTQLSWNGQEPESRDFPSWRRPETEETALAQIVITKMADGRFRIVCFDDQSVVDELATDNPYALFEFTDRLQALGRWRNA